MNTIIFYFLFIFNFFIFFSLNIPIIGILFLYFNYILVYISILLWRNPKPEVITEYNKLNY